MIVWADGYHEAQAFSRIRALESALEIYYTETGQYPSSLNQLIERNLITDEALQRVRIQGLRYVGVGADYELITGDE